jgi:tRNA A-37 threonylcarbamoyl transferase component Bud32
MAEALAAWTTDATLATRPGRVVLRARRGLECPVVLKATSPGAGWSARAALRREARLLDAVRGEGIAELLDVVDRRGRTAVVLAFVPAGTLAERAAPDPGTVTCRLAATVDRLHRAGVVHGALRPEHVALDAEGRPVLVGFGVARHSTDTSADECALADLRRSFRSGA